MNIWQIDPASLTPYYDLSLCEALANDGHEVRFVSSRYLYDPDLYYPTVITTDLTYFKPLTHSFLRKWSTVRKVLRGLLYPLGHTQVIMAMRAHRPDVVHMQWSRFPRFDRAFVRTIQGMGIPIIHTIHDVEPLFVHGLFAGDLRIVYETEINAYVVHTEENRGRFLKNYPTIPPEKVHIIPLIISHMGVKSEMGDREQARAALKVKQDAFVVLFFGNIKPYKGLEVLISALPEVLAHDERIEIWIVGHPEGEADRRLLAQIEDMPRVRVVADYVPSESVWKYHAAADVVVFPYHKISQSAALATALSFGCAVIVTNVGGLPDMVMGNGWIIPPNDPAVLASTIITAGQDPAALEQMRIRSKELANGVFSSESVAHQHVALYEDVIAMVNQ